MSDFAIYIPTMGRVGKQDTLRELSRSATLIANTFLVVPASEFDTYDDEYGLDVDILSCPDNIKGICATRQWIVDYTAYDNIFMLDDDMVFFKRIANSVKLEPCSPRQLEAMFFELSDWLDSMSFPVVGLSARQGNNHVTEDYVEATRQMNFHGVNVEYFNRLDLRFDGMEVMEDFHMLLDMLTQGQKNRVMYKYCWNQRGSGAKGGCSSYRDNALQTKCANQLKKDYPDFVTVVEKKSKTGWEGMETRTDVRVQWKKAYHWGLENSIC